MMAKKILFIILFVNLFCLHQVFADIPLVIAERESIRIVAFYYLDKANPREKMMISEQLVPAAISYYQATLKVNRRKSPIFIGQYRSQDCAQVEPQKSMEKGIEADLVLLVKGYLGYFSNAIAGAKYCYHEDPTNRPLIGSVHFNLMKGFYSFSESLLLATLHEIGHILGFDRDLFRLFLNPLTGKKLLNPTMKKEVNGILVTVLKLEPLTKRLRDYFACPTLEGAYLEQQGDSGSIDSHFERRIFMNEFMTATTMHDARISEFYLALLEGTGWYTPNYEMSEPMYWGKGKGCDFLNTKCLNSSGESNFPDHFCTDLGKETCSFDRTAYGKCGVSIVRKDYLYPAFDYRRDGTVYSSDGFSDNCPYRYTEDTFCEGSRPSSYLISSNEHFGPQSACFTGSFNGARKESPFCFKKSCQKIESDQYVLNVEVDNRTIVCQKEGRMKAGYSNQGYINCPDPVSYCTLLNISFCRRGCMGRGTCVNNQCVCKKGYSGSDCSSRNMYTTQAEGLPIKDQELPTESPQAEELPKEDPPTELLPTESPLPKELPKESAPSEELSRESSPTEELPRESSSPEELPQESSPTEELSIETMNPSRIIIPLLIMIIISVLCVIIKRKVMKKKDQNDQERKEVSTQKMTNFGESSALEMPNFRLLNTDWNEHGREETQIAEQNASSVIPFIKMENQE